MHGAPCLPARLAALADLGVCSVALLTLGPLQKPKWGWVSTEVNSSIHFKINTNVVSCWYRLVCACPELPRCCPCSCSSANFLRRHIVSGPLPIPSNPASLAPACA